MNINELFLEQEKLDNEIVKKHNLQGQDLLKKKVTALLTELYECVNEARFFKFWSTDQKARTTANCWSCQGNGEGYFSGSQWTGKKELCISCEGTGIDKQANPLLEELVDTIHFALSIANDLNYTKHDYIDPGTQDLNDLVRGLTNLITLIPEANYSRHISTVFNYLIKLGYQLGFDEKDVINAYYKKNEKNYERQNNNY